MTKEIELTIFFCRGCGRDQGPFSSYCSRCGAKVVKVNMIVCLDGDRVERLLLKGADGV